VPELRDGNVYFQADSDSQLTKARARRGAVAQRCHARG
jgi:hypothetical protein